MYKESYIEDKTIYDFIEDLNHEKSNFLKELEQESNEKNVPIIKNDVADTLKCLLTLKKPKRILEIGTAVGYSSIFFRELIGPDCSIDTFEINEEMIREAKKNIETSGFSNNINIIEGDALINLKNLNNFYDFAFIDASKGHYREFFDFIFPHMNEKGVIVCDNILYKGLVCLDIKDVPRRKRTIARNMRGFIEYVYSDKRLSTSIIPVGDGLMVSYINDQKIEVTF